MVEMSSNEVLADYVRKLGDAFGSSYYHAHAEWCDLWLTWKQFRNLFCREPERVDLMNRSGAGFFERVQRLFLDAIFLAVCRLADPIKSAGKPNLTVKLFQQFMNNEEQNNKMAELFDRVEKSTDFARDWRNRRISHNDYFLKLGGAVPLKEATIEAIDKAIDALFQVLSYVEHEFMKSAMHNEVIDGLNNEMVMLNRLYLGDEVFQNNVKLLGSGKYAAVEFPKWLMNS